MVRRELMGSAGMKRCILHFQLYKRHGIRGKAMLSALLQMQQHVRMCRRMTAVVIDGRCCQHCLRDMLWHGFRMLAFSCVQDDDGSHAGRVSHQVCMIDVRIHSASCAEASTGLTGARVSACLTCSFLFHLQRVIFQLIGPIKYPKTHKRGLPGSPGEPRGRFQLTAASGALACIRCVFFFFCLVCGGQCGTWLPSLAKLVLFLACFVASACSRDERSPGPAF